MKKLGISVFCSLAFIASPSTAEEAPSPPPPASEPPSAPTTQHSASPAQAAATRPEELRRNGFNLGMTLHRFQDDFGAGLLLGTPTFANDTVRITAGGGIAWYPYAIGESGSQAWLPYYHARLVTEGGIRLQSAPIRLYGFGGFVAVFTPSRLSGDVVHPGGIGGFGFEFYMPTDGRDGPVSYHVELGGIGTGVSADNLPGKPILANGFLATVGFRFYP